MPLTRRIRCALFDFDGTLSLLREGWQDIMAALMLERLLETPAHESRAELEALVHHLIAETTGQQTVYQMIRLAEEVERRGGKPEHAETYKHLFAGRLLARVDARVAAIQSGERSPREWIVPGALPLLESLRERGVTCYILSGTDEVFVRREAALLGLAGYMADIFGARPDFKSHTKRRVIARLVQRHALAPGEWVTFGDGAAEIADTREAGGIAVGVATVETGGGGINPAKRATLLQAGADLILPDFADHAALIAYLFPG